MILLLKLTFATSFVVIWALIGMWCYKEDFHAKGSYLDSIFVSLIYTLGLYMMLLCAIGSIYSAIVLK